MEKIEKLHSEKQATKERIIYIYMTQMKSFKKRVSNCMICCKVIKKNEAEKLQLAKVSWPEELWLLGDEWELSMQGQPLYTMLSGNWTLEKLGYVSSYSEANKREEKIRATVKFGIIYILRSQVKQNVRSYKQIKDLTDNCHFL